jgi:uncharacterized membrane protein YvlD (DUF360 family)
MASAASPSVALHHRFWSAFWGAIIVGLMSWRLSITLCDKRHDREPS